MSTPDGLFIVDKPAGWTSHDVVGRTRRLAGTRKVGHAGTLDPMATGVLVLGIGKATRLLTYLVGCDKDYVATIRLGQSTVTDDADGDITARTDAAGLTPADITTAAMSFVGDIEQVPSAVSAIKIDGRRSYARVQAGEEVQLAPRPVHVEAFTVQSITDGPVLESRTSTDPVPDDTDEPGPRTVDVDVAVTVSSGTYVRALARDLGWLLGVGGHLTMLRRTRVGAFTLAGAHRLADVSEAVADGQPLPIIGLAKAAQAAFPVRRLTDQERWKVSHGQRIPSAADGTHGPIAAVAEDGVLVALMDESAAMGRSLVVFDPASS